MRNVPEVTMVHPRADGELPASICESIALAAGSAIGPPSMTASSNRKIAALIFIYLGKMPQNDNGKAGV
jgi:hypothetical protein